MARILVADDNSNIQKMVGLALKDQGIEVVAVGNGEAAVRKIPDFRPDVVLADVFMPVRNGYEVCEFIKKNEKLSHIPVILLVGAFDPLDEQEAQRVGADGVLKKPFVPPDPLISMVRSALARTGVETPGSASMSSREPVPILATVPVIPSPVITEFAMPEAPQDRQVHATEDASAGTRPLAIDEGHRHLAFGSLLNAPTDEKEAGADESFMSASHPGLEAERRWNEPARDDEGEEEAAEEPPSWRRSIDDLFDSVGAIPTRAVGDWRDIVPGAPQQDTAPTVEASPITESANPFEQSPSTSASVPPESPSSYWQGEQTPVSAAPAPVEEARSEAPSGEPASPPPSFTPENFPGLFVEEKLAAPAESPQTTEEPLVEQEFVPPASASNWEEEVRRAARLVATWETAPAAPEPAAPSQEFAPGASETSSEWPGSQATAPASSSFEPAADDAVTGPSDEAQRPSHPSTADEPAPPVQFDPPEWYRKFQATPGRGEEQEAAPAGSPTEPPQAPDMEALVAKVLEKMSPNVLQQVTRDMLKPMVEALVREELDKKK